MVLAMFALLVGSTRSDGADLINFDMNGITDANISDLQYQTGNQLVYGANLTDWVKSGFNAVHAIQLSGDTPGGPGNYAIMIFGDNLITQQTAFAANDLGVTYYVSYDIGPTVYANPAQATQAGDQLRINLLRPDDSVLTYNLFAPGAWAGVQTFQKAYFSYVGDGNGPLRLQILSEQPGNGRFAGAVDNISFWNTVPVPEPSTYILGLISTGIFAAMARKSRRRAGSAA
jgi:hypothetical protein